VAKEKPWRTPKKRLREKDVEKSCKDWARSRDWWVRKFKSPGNRSVPDDVFAKNGRAVWVEFKKPGEVSTPLQVEEQNAMRAVGLEVYADVDSKEKFLVIFERLEREVSWLS
jgi:hypothetical protein